MQKLKKNKDAICIVCIYDIYLNIYINIYISNITKKSFELNTDIHR